MRRSILLYLAAIFCLSFSVGCRPTGTSPSVPASQRSADGPVVQRSDVDPASGDVAAALEELERQLEGKVPQGDNRRAGNPAGKVDVDQVERRYRQLAERWDRQRDRIDRQLGRVEKKLRGLRR